MTYHAILIASVVLLLAFAIERIGRVSGVPAVIVMVIVGIVARPMFAAMGLTLDGLDVTVPILGTIGLVLIVLEGALDIKLRREQLRLVSSAITMAVAGFVLCTALFAMAAVQALDLSYLQALIISIPFAVIGSAVAIQSSHFLPAHGRQFVIYESSISDILGVLVFFALLNSDGSFGGVVRGLLGGGALSLLLATVCSVGLALMLMHIDGHIRFIPLLAGLFALYSIGEILHLSPLIMVLLFGLALNNPKIITRFKPLRSWTDSSYETTLMQFKLLVMEFDLRSARFLFHPPRLLDRPLHAGIALCLAVRRVHVDRRICRALCHAQVISPQPDQFADLDRPARTDHRGAVPRRQQYDDIAALPQRNHRSRCPGVGSTGRGRAIPCEGRRHRAGSRV